MALIDFKPEHLESMDLTFETKDFARRHVPTLTGLAAVNMAGTIVAPDGTHLGVLGAWPLDKKTCEVFILAAEARRLYPLEFVKTVKATLRHVRHYFPKVQALGQDTRFFNRWFRWLGFIKEGPAERSGCAGMLIWRFEGGV